MEQTKPYSLQSPEAIAKEYGGNKQRIAKAAQMGMIDPTAAVVAGMFIDRMRSAAVQEMAPQQTVAQKVMAPAPQGIAGLPAAQMAQAQMPTPQQAPMGASAAPMPPAPEQPMMAAEGGLMNLDVPDDMYNYGGGGIVAFAAGTPGYADPDFLAATGLTGYDMGQDYAGLGAIAPAADEDEYEKRYKRELELRKKYLGDTGTTKEEARNMALLQAGLGIMGGTSPYALQNVATGSAPAVAQYASDLKGIRAEEAKAMEGAFKRQADLEEKKLAAGKTTELDRAAAVFLKGLGAKGYDVKDPQVQAAAYEMAFNAKGLTEYKGELSTAQGMAAKWELANKETNRILDNTKSAPGLEYFLATQRDAAAKKAGKPANEAAAIRQRVMDEQLASLPDPTKPKGGMFKLPELKKPAAQDKADQKVEEAKKPEPKKGPPGFKKPDLSKVQGLPSGSKLGTYVAGKGWQVIQGGNIIGHIQAD